MGTKPAVQRAALASYSFGVREEILGWRQAPGLSLSSREHQMYGSTPGSKPFCTALDKSGQALGSGGQATLSATHR